MSASNEFLTHLDVIKDLSIEGPTANAIGIKKRLVSSCARIQYGETPMGQANAEGVMRGRSAQWRIGVTNDSRAIFAGVFGPRRGTLVWIYEEIPFIVATSMAQSGVHSA